MTPQIQFQPAAGFSVAVEQPKRRTFFNFEPFTDRELEGMSPEQLKIELQFSRAVYSLVAVLAPHDHSLTPVIGGEVRGL